MTDKDLALKNIREVKGLMPQWSDKEIEIEYEEYLDGFLAGLKAGRPQWHNLRENPNDLPERDKSFVTEVSVIVIVYPLGFAMYYFFDKKWYSNGKEVKVDRWCEIPTFDKE